MTETSKGGRRGVCGLHIIPSDDRTPLPPSTDPTPPSPKIENFDVSPPSQKIIKFVNLYVSIPPYNGKIMCPSAPNKPEKKRIIVIGHFSKKVAHTPKIVEIFPPLKKKNPPPSNFFWHLPFFSCDSSSMPDNVRRSVCRSVGLSVGLCKRVFSSK